MAEIDLPDDPQTDPEAPTEPDHEPDREPRPPAEPILGRSPEEGARRLALAFLDQAAAARPRLRDAHGDDGDDDEEALHDFRVGLRRLRSAIRAYRGALAGSVPRKLERRLKRLADATGTGRDTEVQIDWLRAQRPALAPYQRPGLRWLLERLAARRAAAYERIAGKVAGRFDELETDLRARLSVYTAEVHLDRGEPEIAATLGRTAAAILAREVDQIRERLASIAGPEDVARAHQARIAAKRLRYLVEPLADELAGREAAAKPLLRRIKDLQDLLGELHDAHVLEDELGDALAAAAIERAAALLAATLAEVPDDKLLRAERRPGREAGMLALARLNRERRDRLFGDLAESWLDGRADGFLDEVAALGELLAAS
jgi:CHAD domain-containing protein